MGFLTPMTEWCNFLISLPALSERILSLAEAGTFEGVVRLDDVAQALLEGAVAAIGIRVEALHQGLVLGLDSRPVGGLVEAEDVESPAHRPRIARALWLRSRPARAGLG